MNSHQPTVAAFVVVVVVPAAVDENYYSTNSHLSTTVVDGENYYSTNSDLPMTAAFVDYDPHSTPALIRRRHQRELSMDIQEQRREDDHSVCYEFCGMARRHTSDIAGNPPTDQATKC